MPLTINDITPLIRSQNPNKATGSDGISSHMLLLCDETVVLPLVFVLETPPQTNY